MRFMMLMIPKVYQGTGSQGLGTDYAPSAEAVQRMMRYNERLAEAGALVALEGLHPPQTGARVTFRQGETEVTDSAFGESKDVLGGYWLIRADSMREVVDWAKQCPADDGDVIEIRQVFDTSDWPEDVRHAAESPVVRAAIDAGPARH